MTHPPTPPAAPELVAALDHALAPPAPLPGAGLGVTQRVVLAALAERGTSWLAELQRDTGVDTGHVARSLASLKARGLAEPATLPARVGVADSRRPVRLTAAGRDAASRVAADPRTASGTSRPSKTSRDPNAGHEDPKEGL